jgi:hypothetical protein
VASATVAATVAATAATAATAASVHRSIPFRFGRTR